MTPTKIFPKILICVSKSAELDADFKFVENSVKKFIQKSY
jgi:hypothetical protein